VCVFERVCVCVLTLQKLSLHSPGAVHSFACLLTHSPERVREGERRGRERDLCQRELYVDIFYISEGGKGKRERGRKEEEGPASK
jgi:hypothetical protein